MNNRSLYIKKIWACILSVVMLWSLIPAPAYAEAPKIESINPDNGTSAGGTLVTIKGSNFGDVKTTEVLFGSSKAKIVSVQNDGTIITAETPSYLGPFINGEAKVDVTVITSNGQYQYISDDGFTYKQSKPQIKGVAPVTGTVGTEITITGEEFINSVDNNHKLIVKIGGIEATRVTFVSSTTIRAVVPLQVSGEKEITVENPDGGSASWQGFYYQKSTPTISSITPSKGPVGTTTEITIKGTNFIAGYMSDGKPITTVTIGGQPATDVVVVDEKTITAKTPADIFTTGPRHVVVTVDGVNAIRENGFTFISNPQITGILPSKGSVLGGYTVDITGSGFMTGAKVRFGDRWAQTVTVRSSSQITATVPAASYPGIVDVTVTNPDGGEAIFSPANDKDKFTYTQTTLSITSVSNSLSKDGPAQSSVLGGETIYIRGKGFGSDGYPEEVKVYIGGKLCEQIKLEKIVKEDGEEEDVLSVVTPPSNVDGVATIRVVNKDGGSVTNDNSIAKTRFVYVRSKPEITRFDPDNASTVSQGTITIEGNGFMDGAQVYFGDIKAEDVSVITGSGVINATIPEVASPRSSLIKVVNPDKGEAVAENKFQFNVSAPIITSTVQGEIYAPINTDMEYLLNIKVNTGSTVGGTPIRIEGKDFSKDVKITIGGRPVQNIRVFKESPDRHIITAVTPPGEAGERPIVITNPDDSSVSSVFKYVISPTITGITPNSGTTEGGQEVIIDGTGFPTEKENVKVFFGGVEVKEENIKEISSTRIVVKTPPNSAGPKDVTVISLIDYGMYTEKSGYTYVLPPSSPVIEKIEPTSGSTAGGTQITLYGKDIRSGAVLTIGGKFATDVIIETFEEDGIQKVKVTAKTPAGNAGEQEVRITNPDGRFAVSPTPFTYKIPEKALSVVSITPNKGSIMGGTKVTVYGANFVQKTLIENNVYKMTKVTIGGNECTNILVSDDLKTITATTPGGSVGYQDVIVKIVKVKYDGQQEEEIEIESQVILKGAFSYEVPQSTPIITSVKIYNRVTDKEEDPIGPVSGGNIVRIYGSGFMAPTSGKATEVYFGKNKASIVEVISESLIQVISPSSTQVGAVDVRVVNPDGGEAVAVAGFIYKGNNLIVTNITPNQGTVLGGIEATVTGANFIMGTQVTIGGEAALDVKVVSPTTITVTVPPNTPGLKDVVAYNAYGSYTLKSAFLYYVEQSTPTITEISPNIGSAAGGDKITVKGSGFMSGSNFKLLIGENPANNVIIKSPTELTAITPPGIPGYKDVTVINDDGGSFILTKGFLYLTNPIIESVTPPRGTNKGGMFISIKGRNFMTGADVRFVGEHVYNDGQGVALKDVKVVSDTEIVAFTPALPEGISGYVDLQVTNTDGGRGYKQNAFLYKQSNMNPTITSVTPDRGPVTGDTTITINGKDFAKDAIVVIGDKFATNVKYIDSMTLSAVTPEGSEGPRNVQVINVEDGSFAVKENGFTYMVPRSQPVITKVSPARGSSEGGTPVTIEGIDFSQGISVIIDGIEVKDVNIISPSQMRIVTPRARNYGKKDITVVNTDGGIFTLKQGFEYIPPASVPLITKVTPNKGSIFGGSLITIEGENFAKGLTVYFGGVAGINTQVDQTGEVITVETPEYKPGSADVAEKDGYPVDLIVVNPDTSLALWSEPFYYVVPESRPKITSVSPDRGPKSGGTLITIEGVDFRPGVKVLIGSAEAEVQFIEDEDGNIVDGVSSLSGVKISAYTPAGTPGKADVRVVNPDEGLAVLKNGFEYLDVTGEIGISSIMPTEGAVSGGTPFTIKGYGFVSPVKVYFGGEDAKQVNVIAPDTITGRTPANTQGKKDVVVLNGNGLSCALPQGFEYKVPDSYPRITQVDPARGPAYGGIEVNIYGNGFKPQLKVYIGENEAEVLAVDPAQIRIILPEGTLGPKDVIVINPDTGLDILEEGFTYIDYPRIDKIDPKEGPIEGGTSVTLTGSYFQRGAVVTIGGKAVSNITFVDDGTLTFKTPAHTAGFKDVILINPDGGQAILKNGFYYIPPRTKPDAPENLSARKFDEITIKLTWEPVLNASYYEIYGAYKSSGPFEYIDKTTNSYYYVTDLEPDTRYYFRVRAVNELGASPYSERDYAYTDDGKAEKIVDLPDEAIKYLYGDHITILDVDALKDLNYILSFKSKGPSPLSKFTADFSYSAVKNAKKDIVIKGESVTLRLSPSRMETVFKGLSSSEQADAIISIVVETASKQQKEQMLKFKDKNKQPVSEIYSINAFLQVKRQRKTVDITGQLDIAAKPDIVAGTAGKNLGIYKFDEVVRKWVSISPTYYPDLFFAPATFIMGSGWYAVFAE